jgi:hypothetical protein
MPPESRKATAEELAFLNGKPTETPAPSGLIPLLEGDQIAQEGWADDPVMVGRMLIDGFTWGLADEAVGAIRGAINKTIRQDPRPYREIYTETINGLEQTRAQYEERNPAAAIGLNVAGSIPSGGAIKSALTKGFGVVAPVVAPMIPSTLNFGRATPLVAGATVIAAEGAVSGVGYAQQGEDLGQAAIDGMTTNLMFGAALSAGGAAFRGASKRRVAEELGTGADFKPIPVAAPGSTLSRVYTNILGKTFFGANLLEQQVNRWRVPLARNIQEQSAALKNLGSMSSVERSLQQQVAAARKELKSVAEGKVAGITEDAASKFEEETARIVSINGARATRIDDAVNMRERIFRNRAVELSLPSSMPAEEAQKVITSSRTMQEALSASRDAFEKYGYKYLDVTADGSQRIFSIDPSEFMDEIKKGISGNAEELILQFGGDTGKAATLVQEYLAAVVKDGKISGSQLSEMRSTLGSMLGSLMEQGGEAAQRGYVIKHVLESVNQKIRGQLSGDEVKLFDADNAAWNSKMILERAVGAASVVAGNRGAFTPSQWLAATRTVNPRRLSGGQAILQNEADTLGLLQTRRDDIIKQITAHQNIRQKQAVASRKALIDRESRSVQAEMRANLERQVSGITQEGAAATADLLSRQRALADMSGRLDSINKALPENFSDTTLTNLVLMGATGAAGGLPGLVAYLGAGAVAATPGFQRALAGQTAVQAGMRNLVERLPTEQISSVAGRESVRQDQQQFTLSEQDTVARIGNDAAKAAAYRRLQSSGSLEQLRSRNFSAFKSLQEAFNRQQ